MALWEDNVVSRTGITRISTVPRGTSLDDSMNLMDTGTAITGGQNSISIAEERKHVHFGEQVVVEEFPCINLYRKNPNETAFDMIEAYKSQCVNLRVKPLSKLLEQLAKLDSLSTPIDTLDLNNVRLDSRTCETLEAVLSRMSMTTISIEHAYLDDDGFIALCEMIEFYECASRLSVGGNSKLKTRAWLCFGRMLKKVNFIEMVDVKHCSLDEQGLTLLLRSIRANCTLKVLHLEGNNLTGKGIFILMAAMKFNENLKELYLGNNRICPDDCQNLGNILRTNHTLTHLDLRDNYIQNHGLRYVCAGIAEQQTGLLVINLSSNNISPDGMHHIAVMLPCTKSLQDINLSNNRLGDYGIMTVKLSLLANRSLLKLTLNRTHITCEGAIALAEFVAENRLIEHIDVSDNDIRIAGVMALSLAYKMNFTLLHLQMPKTIKIEPRDKDLARDLMSNVEEYSARNLKMARERQKQQQKSPAEEDEPPPKTAEEEAEEQRLRSSLGNVEVTEDPFSEDIVDKQEAASGTSLEKALDSLLLANITGKDEIVDECATVGNQTSSNTSVTNALCSDSVVGERPSDEPVGTDESSNQLPNVAEESASPEDICVTTAVSTTNSDSAIPQQSESSTEVPMDISSAGTHPLPNSMDSLQDMDVTREVSDFLQNSETKLATQSQHSEPLDGSVKRHDTNAGGSNDQLDNRPL